MTLEADDLVDCLRVLETLVEDRGRLAEVDRETRSRLLVAAGRLSRPERGERRTLARALRRKKELQARVEDRALLANAGIRQKRLAPVFVTPGALELGETREPGWEAQPTEVKRERACYVCKERCTRMHYFYDQMCGACGDFNFAKRSQTADLSRTRGADHRRSRQDRLPGRDHAAPCRRARDRDDALSARCGAALRARSGLRGFRDGSQIYGLDLRHTPERRGVRQATRTSTSAPRLHAAQRLSDRAPAGGFLSTPDGRASSRRSLAAGAAARASPGDYEAMRAKSLHTLEGSASGSPGGLRRSGSDRSAALSQVALTAADR